MDIESQVCSLNLARHLKELGVKQESYFYWIKQLLADTYLLHYVDSNHWSCDAKMFKENFPDKYSAFTCAELGEMLPDFIELSKVENIKIATCYSEDNNVSMIDDTESNVRAKMLIYLIENNLLNPNESFLTATK